MLRLKELTLKNFRSFRDSETITFPDSGLVCLRGRNLDTGVSSGSGKSSVLLAISYALGYCPFDGTILKSWGTKSNPYVKLVLTDGDKTIEVVRGIGFDVLVNGESVGGNAAHKEKALQSLVRVPLHVLGALTYRPQGQPSYFLSLTDSKKKEFLSEILDLNKFEVAAEQAGKEANLKKSELDKLVSALEALKSTAPTPPTWEPIDLGPYLKELETVEARAIALKQELLQLQSKQTGVNVAIREMLGAINKEFRPKIEELEARLKEIKSRPSVHIEDNTQKLKDRLAVVRTRIEEAEQQHDASISEKQAALKELSKGIVVWEKAVQRAAEATKKKKEFLKKQQAIKNEMKCPTCTQPWIGTGAENELDRIAKEILVLEKIEAEGVEAQEILDGGAREKLRIAEEELDILRRKAAVPELYSNAEKDLMAKIASETQAINSRRLASKLEKENEIAGVQKAISDLKLEEERAVASIGQEHGKEDQRLQQEIIRAQTALRGLDVGIYNERIASIKQQNIANEKRYRQELVRYERLASSIEDKEKQVKSAEREWAALKDFAGLVGREGFLGAIFDEILAEISMEVNKRLSTFPNVQHITFKWQSERETASGTVRKEIRPVLLANGIEVPLTAVSGGQNSSIQQAVDRAVREVVARRTGLNPGWVVMDESFEGMDGTVKENCLETLKEMASDTLVLVVDHSKEFLELFDRQLEIECVEGKSTVKWYRE